MRRGVVPCALVACAMGVACASVLGVDTVDYADAGDARAGDEAGGGDGHVPAVVCSVDGGVCSGALAVCCVSFTANPDKCVATTYQKDCPAESNVTAPVECDDVHDCPSDKVCCTFRSNAIIISSICVASCDDEIGCDPRTDVCPPDAGKCAFFDSVHGVCK